MAFYIHNGIVVLETCARLWLLDGSNYTKQMDKEIYLSSCEISPIKSAIWMSNVNRP